MVMQRVMWVAWPAFLMAAVLEMLVFAVVDPQTMYLADEPFALSRQGIYTLAFFVFWGVIMAAGLLTTMLSVSPFELNRCPVPRDSRPSDCAKFTV